MQGLRTGALTGHAECTEKGPVFLRFTPAGSVNSVRYNNIMGNG